MKLRCFCSGCLTLIFLACCLGTPRPIHAQAKRPLTTQAQTQSPLPFEEAAYLYNKAYDQSLGGDSSWEAYKSPLWLNVPSLGVESDPGWDNWSDCCGDVNWNAPWGQMQATHPEMKDVILGIGQMPFHPYPNSSYPYSNTLYNGSWQDQEAAAWEAEASNNQTLMGYFAQYAKDVDSMGFTSVIIRLGYEFDGGWDPYGNLNQMSGRQGVSMPGTYIKAWQNIVTAMRAADTKRIIKFCWNPTDVNVGQVQQFSYDPGLAYYPGDAYVDYIGIDEYDATPLNDGGSDTSGDSGYTKYGSQPTVSAQQGGVWTTYEKPRLDNVAGFASATKIRPNSTTASVKPIIMGEWGLWQLGDGNHPSGGDNPSYIQNMYTWMVNNHVYMESYFEAPADGVSTLWPGYYYGQQNHWTTFPNAAATYRSLFGGSNETPYGGAVTVPGTVQAENYDTGGLGLAYNYAQNGGSHSSYRPADLVGIQACGDVGGGYNIGWTNTGQWTNYTVNVPTAGTYFVSFRVAAANAGGTFHLQTPEGNWISTEITVPATGGWWTWGSTAPVAISLPAGTQTLRLCQDSGGYNLNSMTVTGHGGDVPFSGAPAALPGTIPCDNYDIGGLGQAYWYGAADHSFSAYRPLDLVDLEGCNDYNNGHGYGNGDDLGSETGGQWTNYTVNVPTAGTYYVTFRYAAVGSNDSNGNWVDGGTFDLRTPGSNQPNLSGLIHVAGTGYGWQTWFSTTPVAVSLAAGTQTIELYQDTGGCNLNTMTFTGP